MDAKLDDDDDDGKDDAKSSSSRRLVREVFEYFSEDEDLEATLRKFCFAQCAAFATPRPCEFRLEQTRLHGEFKDLFEAEIEAFIRERGATVRSFYRAVASDMRRTTELYSGHTLANAIAMALKFENFYDLMHDAYRSGVFYWGVPLLQDVDTLEFCFD